MMARLERLERRESKPLRFVCESAIVCVHGVCTCVGVCTMPVLRVRVGGCYVCACVYTSCRDGTWRPRIAVYADQVCCVCVHGYVLCFLYMPLHAAFITECPVFLSLSFLYVFFFFVVVKVSVSICVCGLHVPVTYV